MAKIFMPTTNKDTLELLAKARKTNEERDKIDRQNSGLAPGDCAINVQLQTAISAIVAGLDLREKDQKVSLDCIAEGVVMLQDAEKRFRQE